MFEGDKAFNVIEFYGVVLMMFINAWKQRRIIMEKNIDYYMSLNYRMEVYPDEVEGGYTASFPDLPGCLTCAETMEALIENANDAKKEWLTAALEEGYKIAEPIE